MYAEQPSSVPGATRWSSDAGDVAHVVPDAALDLIWFGDHLIVAGPDTRPQPLSSAPVDLVGFRFAPGTAADVLGVPADELRDSRVRLDQLWSSAEVGRWQAAVARDGAAALETLSARRLAEADSRPEIDRIVWLCRSGAPTSRLVAETGWSERTLHRRSRAAFGYGAKTLARIFRFQRAQRLLQSGLPIADVAARAGFADQPHLSRELRALGGLSPAGFAQHRASPVQ